MLFQTGDEVNTPAPDAIALDWSAADSADVVARNRDWQDAFYEAMLPFATPGSYQNFPDPSLTDWLQSYYGSNLPRLREIKALADPTSVFRYPQGIPPA